MPDAALVFNSDFSLSATGDLAMVDGAPLGQQRVLRRLLTNPGDYLWHLQYGAGLGAMVGTPTDPNHISAIIRGQIMQESAVASTPAPVILVDAQATGIVAATVTYADAITGATQVVPFQAPA